MVLFLGKQRAIELYNETKEVEAQGGMLLMVSKFIFEDLYSIGYRVFLPTHHQGEHPQYLG